MRSRLSSLRRQADRLEQKIGRAGEPKHWFFMLPTGAGAPDCIKSQMRTNDTYFIRWVPADYFYSMCGDDARGSCVMISARRGNFIVDMETGVWERVRKNH